MNISLIDGVNIRPHRSNQSGARKIESAGAPHEGLAPYISRMSWRVASRRSKSTTTRALARFSWHCLAADYTFRGLKSQRSSGVYLLCRTRRHRIIASFSSGPVARTAPPWARRSSRLLVAAPILGGLHHNHGRATRHADRILHATPHGVVGCLREEGNAQ